MIVNRAYTQKDSMKAKILKLISEGSAVILSRGEKTEVVALVPSVLGRDSYRFVYLTSLAGPHIAKSRQEASTIDEVVNIIKLGRWTIYPYAVLTLE